MVGHEHFEYWKPNKDGKVEATILWVLFATSTFKKCSS